MTVHEQQSTLRAAILDAILSSPEPLKMSEIAYKVGLVEEGYAVPSTIGAKVRVQTKHLLAQGKIAKSGETATRRYFAPVKKKKAKKAVKKPAAKKPAPKKAPKKKAKKKKANKK